jgi:hypothetical protein
MSPGGDRLVVRGGRAMETRVARLARGLTLRREATHYPGGTPAQAISESKFVKLTPWILEEGPSVSAEERHFHPFAVLKMTPGNDLGDRPSGRASRLIGVC